MNQQKQKKYINNSNSNKDKIDPEREMAFESLPPHIRNNMTQEEIQLFLYAREWPESMFKKFDEFIFPQ